jgi:hypothetical protein
MCTSLSSGVGDALREMSSDATDGVKEKGSETSKEREPREGRYVGEE